MSVEHRLVEALRATGDYEPSVDLYARLSRSIAETWAHRRRVRWAVIGIGAGVPFLAAYLVAVAQFGQDGFEGFPSWSLQLAVLIVLVTVLVTVGPTIRRLGAPLIEEVFRMSPETGKSFTRLLDIAYYLFFSGVILESVDLENPGATLDLTDIWGPVGAIAVFLTALGVAHIANLAVLPVVGLVFSAVARRADRAAARGSVGQISSRARSADRLATAIAMVGVFLMLAAVLGAVAVTILVGLGL